MFVRFGELLASSNVRSSDIKLIVIFWYRNGVNCAPFW